MTEVKPEPFHVIEGDRVEVEPNESPAENVGAFLREARETTGRSVADVAGSLRIRAKFLQSIEDGRYEDLPGQAYAVGFIRSYADYLGLETAVLLDQFKEEASGAEKQPDLDFPEPSTDGWFPTGKVVSACAVVAAAVFAGWYFIQTDNSVDVTTVPSPPGFESVIGAQAANQQPDEAAVAVAEPATPVGAATSDETQAASAEPAETQTGTPIVVTEEPVSSEDEQPVQQADQASEPAPAELAVTEPEPQPQQSQAEPQQEETVSEAPAQAAAEPPVKVVEPPVEVVEVPAEVAEPPAPVDSEPTPTAASITETPPQPVAKPTVAAPPTPEPASPEPATPNLETLVAALPSISADDGVANTGDDGRTYGVINQEARVVIGARADSWVQVLDGNQNVLLTRMLRPGDRYLVPNRNDLVMLTGNAGGLIISVDGDQVPRIGSDGAILHNVRLDVELLRAGRAVIE